MRNRRVIGGLLSLGVLAGAASMAGPAQAQTTSVGPYYATPSWDQTLPSATRFIILSNFAGAAVLDRETGLVWERSPDQGTLNWLGAITNCTIKTTGTRKGWRLPSVHELASLIDPSVTATGPKLPAGHPFANVGPFAKELEGYWSATISANDPTLVWYVIFSSGVVIKDGKTFTGNRYWCVRGGNNADAY